MAGEILFVSDRPSDLAFGKTIADQLRMKFLSARTVTEVEALRNIGSSWNRVGEIGRIS